MQMCIYSHLFCKCRAKMHTPQRFWILWYGTNVANLFGMA